MGGGAVEAAPFAESAPSLLGHRARLIVLARNIPANTDTIADHYPSKPGIALEIVPAIADTRNDMTK